jgi:phosphopantothenoylcysteine decarboxylase/phosphopantothenate--cysteine ligase
MHPSQRIYCTKSEKLKGKRIVLGITGSIAAVEDVKLIRELIRHGADVVPVMSRESTRIVHPNSIHFASGKIPIIEIDGSVPYVDLCGEGGSASLLLIAPSTANTISKIACGIDDTPVTTFATTAMGSDVPIMIAPAMHESMYTNPTVAVNLDMLRKVGVEFIEPKFAEEKAKMADMEDIVAAVIRRLGPHDLDDKRVVVIAGSTEQPIDDVRAITNRSSGGTGIELAKSAYERGGKVELWLGRHEAPVPSYIELKEFYTIEELGKLVKGLKCDYCLVPAAISDFTTKKAKGKIPSRKGALKLDLTPTPKVLKSIRSKTKGVVVGFKAEYGVTAKDLAEKAKVMIKESKLDFAVANDLKDVKRDRTKVIILDSRGGKKEVEGTKSSVADKIWSAVLHGL